jgi:hypothetical protein
VKERRKPMAYFRGKDYFCTVISEGVKIALKNKPYISRKPKNELFVQCNQPDCQYVDLNQSPCPLSLDLFTEEIEKREEKRTDRRMGS